MIKNLNKQSFLTLLGILFLLFSVWPTVLVVAALSYMPEKRGDGKEAEPITPTVSGVGTGAAVILPEVVDEKPQEKPTYEPFIPEFTDKEPFVDMDKSYDFSQQYDYSYAGMSPANGGATFENGTYTATAANALYIHRSSYAPFPYGTISADVLNNGGDSGIVFGLSTIKNNFWEGAGVSYYFAFINVDGTFFLGRTVNGVWSTLAYTDIVGYSAANTYNIKVLYRIDKVVLFLNDVPMISYRTTAPLSGTGWGVRMGTVGSTVGNVVVSNKVTLD
jgi:hypothetical protein